MDDDVRARGGHDGAEAGRAQVGPRRPPRARRRRRGRPGRAGRRARRRARRRRRRRGAGPARRPTGSPRPSRGPAGRARRGGSGRSRRCAGEDRRRPRWGLQGADAALEVVEAAASSRTSSPDGGRRSSRARPTRCAAPRQLVGELLRALARELLRGAGDLVGEPLRAVARGLRLAGGRRDGLGRRRADGLGAVLALLGSLSGCFATGAEPILRPWPRRPSTLHPTAPLAERALLPGDPGRALLLAQSLLDEPRMFNHHRGLWGYTGTAPDGEPLTVQATGLGGPSAAIVLEELARLGLRRAVRIGTGAALDGVATGSATSSRRPRCSAPTGRAARSGRPSARRPDAGLTAGLAAACDHAGLVVSSDVFYEPEGSARAAAWTRAGALAVELQAAALLAVGAARGVAVACVVGRARRRRRRGRDRGPRRAARARRAGGARRGRLSAARRRRRAGSTGLSRRP